MGAIGGVELNSTHFFLQNHKCTYIENAKKQKMMFRFPTFGVGTVGSLGSP